MPDKSPDQRRRFLRMVGCFTVSAAALGLSAADLAALPVTIVDGDPTGAEHRYPVPAADGVTTTMLTEERSAVNTATIMSGRAHQAGEPQPAMTPSTTAASALSVAVRSMRCVARLARSAESC